MLPLKLPYHAWREHAPPRRVARCVIAQNVIARCVAAHASLPARELDARSLADSAKPRFARFGSADRQEAVVGHRIGDVHDRAANDKLAHRAEPSKSRLANKKGLALIP